MAGSKLTAGIELPVIEPSNLYPLATFQKLSGMGRAALRSARRAGLEIKYVGGRAYILGKAFIDFVQANGKESVR